MITAKIVGAGGYGGVGITELILRHPNINIGCLVSLSDTGKLMSDVYPHLKGKCDIEIVSPDHISVNDKFDVVIYSTPDGVGMCTAEDDLNRGQRLLITVVILGSTILSKYEQYINFIGRKIIHKSPHLLNQTQYGLPELHNLDSNNTLIGNPGCFAASCLLALSPAVKNNLIDFSSIICDCKTGTSGAGKKVNSQLHYSFRYENMNAYRLSGHQHIIEIEQQLNLLSDKNINITFTAQLVPLCRGIMSICYGSLLEKNDLNDVVNIYKNFYTNSPFVRVLTKEEDSSLSDVRGTNFCNLIVDIDERTNKLRIISYIDNLMKGQAGNAMQVINKLFDFDDTLGLDVTSQYP